MTDSKYERDKQPFDWIKDKDKDKDKYKYKKIVVYIMRNLIEIYIELRNIEEFGEFSRTHAPVGQKFTIQKKNFGPTVADFSSSSSYTDISFTLAIIIDASIFLAAPTSTNSSEIIIEDSWWR